MCALSHKTGELEKLDTEIVPMRLESYKPTEIEEALNDLKASDDVFKVFYDMDDNFRVLYKMKDGHFGLY